MPVIPPAGPSMSVSKCGFAGMLLTSLNVKHKEVMMQILEDMPANVVGFRATGNVDKDDYNNVVFPAVEELVKRTGELNYLMIIDTPFKNFTFGAWFEDTYLSLMKMSKRHRAAVLTDSEGGNKFTDYWGKIAPGEFKGFLIKDLEAAKKWVAA